MPDTPAAPAPSPADRVMSLTVREQQLLGEAADWVHRSAGPAKQAMERVNALTRKLLQRAMASDGVTAAIDGAAAGLLERIEVTATDIPPAVASLGRTAAPGPAERDRALAQAEDEAQRLERRHRAMLTAQGALSGAAGSTLLTAVAALVTDVAASTAGLVRAAAATLTAYGHTEDLRDTALAVVVLAGEQDPSRRRAGLAAAASLGGPSPDPALPTAMADQAGIRTLNQTVESLLRRRLQQRAVVAVPILGAVAGGATSAHTAARTCATARHVGRVHFVARHCGVQPDELLAG